MTLCIIPDKKRHNLKNDILVKMLDEFNANENKRTCSAYFFCS